MFIFAGVPGLYARISFDFLVYRHGLYFGLWWIAYLGWIPLFVVGFDCFVDDLVALCCVGVGFLC